MLKPISNLKVYDLNESIIASGYPMKTEIHNDAEPNFKDIERVNNLVKASYGNDSHAQFLTGIRVNFDLTFSNKAWVEAERYRFLEFVSSQSTMHRILKFDLDKQYVDYVDARIIAIIKEKIKEYEDLKNQNSSPDAMREKYLEILYSNPCGFLLTARMATNYRCLLNIYNQRHNHRLPEWQKFCEQLIDELPYFKEFVEIYEKEGDKKNDIT